MGLPDKESRDAGLRRVSRATRWFAAGAAGLVGAFSFYASRSLPGVNRSSATDGASPPVVEPAPVPSTLFPSSGASALPSQTLPPVTQAPATTSPVVNPPIQPHSRTRGS